MLFNIEHLKKIRKQLNLTQHQFAKESGVSQSMVAKIESNKLDPTVFGLNYVVDCATLFANGTCSIPS